MKKVYKIIASMIAGIVGAVAVSSATGTACIWIFYQPKVPKCLNK